MSGVFDTYLKALCETPLEEHTEHTGRSALETLLNAFAAEAPNNRIRVQHEPKRQQDKGAPDFKVKSGGMILGYVEVKEVDAPFAKVLKSDQIRKYRTLSDNIILTDYLRFIRIDSAGKVLGDERLAESTDLEGRTIRVNPDRAEAVSKLLTAFFTTPPQGLTRAEQLALALARIIRSPSTRSPMSGASARRWPSPSSR